MKNLIAITYILMLIGAINWSFIGLFDYNAISEIFGQMSTISESIYIVFGLSAVINLTLRYYECAKRKDSCCLINSQ